MTKLFSKFIDQSLFGRMIKNRWFQLILSTLILFVIVHVILSTTLYSFSYDYLIGEVAKEDIVLEEDYIDQNATLALKEAVKYQVDISYTTDKKVYADAKEAISNFYNQAYDIREEYLEDETVKISVFTYHLSRNFALSSDELSVLATMEDIDLKLTENYIYDVLRDIFDSGVTDENIIERKESVDDYFNTVDQIDDTVKPIIAKIVKYHIQINRFVDQEATNASIEKGQAAIEDVVIPKGTLLIAAGDPIDFKTFEIMNYFNLNDLHTFEQKIPMLGMDLLIAFILVLMLLLLAYSYKGKSFTGKYIYLNYMIVIIVFLIAYALRNVSIYLLPMATVAMLISILERDTSGIIYSFFATVLYGIVFSLPLIWIIFTLLGCMLSAILVYRSYQRSRIFLAGLLVGIINSLAIFAYGMNLSHGITLILENLVFGLVSGLASAILTVGFLPIWETLFRMLTPFRLLELSNPNHPLLKKLLLESPGTYHHSILVANLSEAAAHEVDANGLIARVGSYFHDIGKIEKPFMFVENQYDGNNPHDQLVPRVSAKVIKGHVEAGLNLGKEYKLPIEVMDFIRTHHGMTKIKYFYHKASEASSEDVDPQPYTYDGPIPFTKEQAIVMLADSIEAAVRSVQNANRSVVESLIDKIIGDKIDSHQLDKSGLTIGEINKIKKSFMSNLSSAFHERIEYPDLKEDKTEVKGV